MLARIAVLTSLLASSLAFAQGNNEFVPNGVITSLTAEPANGGFNPEFIGVRLQGTVKAGGNACEGSQYEVSLKPVNQGRRIVYVAKLKAKPNEMVMFCPMFIDMNYKGIEFDQTIILSDRQFKKTFIAHVGKKGTLVSLKSLFETQDEAPVASSCEVGPCTKEYSPVSCTFMGHTISAGNLCEARDQARVLACKSNLTFVPEALSCTSVSPIRR